MADGIILTPEGLPVVSVDVIEVFTRDVKTRFRKDGFGGVVETKRDLQVNNICLYDFMNASSGFLPRALLEVANKTNAPVEAIISAAYEHGFQDCYKLLRAQSSVNQRKTDFNSS